MENFSVAYLRAMAAAQGLSVTGQEDDVDSIDLTISARGRVTYDGVVGKRSSPRLAVQMKCTHAHVPKNGVLKYPLSIKNYNDLSSVDRMESLVLIVLCVPKTWSKRLRWSDKSMSLKRVAFWTTLRGEPPTENKDNIKVTLTNILSPDELMRLMFMVSEGKL